MLAAGQAQTGDSRDALARLCESYWYPLYAYVRRWGYDADQAQDLTQEFFAHAAREALPPRGRPGARPVPVVPARLAEALPVERARPRRRGKRGGRATVVPLEFENAEGRYSREPADTETPETVFERRWALTLLERTLGRLRGEFAAAGKQALFARLEGHLTGDQEALPYADLCAELGMSEGAIKVAVHRLRRRFGALLREEIGETVSDPARWTTRSASCSGR